MEQWELSPLGKGYSIQSLHTNDYLTIEDGLSNLTPVVASPYPVSWVLAPFDAIGSIWRITWPNTKLTIGLPNVVENELNTLARLVEIDSFGSRSLWRFVPQKGTPEEVTAAASSDLKAASALPESLTTTDTKVGDDGSLTITTTTTTVITTSTRVAKTIA
ncbi:hypothetical protein H2248_002171 [Termitomyces sp. 'cryptogamus']|nr:hypothetical protein H2248_002171 [Termitomyces sp. 'cryptogamus']